MDAWHLIDYCLTDFFSPLLTVQVPAIGGYNVTGYDIFSKTREFSQELLSLSEHRSQAESVSTGSPSSVSDKESPFPMSVEAAPLVPIEVLLAFVGAVLAIPGCLGVLKQSLVRATSAFGCVAAVIAIVHLIIINSDLHTWFDQSV